MPKIVDIDKKKLKYLYLVKRLNSYKVADVFNCSQSLVMKRLREYSIPSRSVQEAKALTIPKYKRRDFNGNPKEKAYLIGFRLGDLYVTKTHPNSPTIRIRSNTTKKEQLELVRKLFLPYGYVREYKRDKNGAISTGCFVNNSFGFLIKKWDGIESWILRKKKYFLSFLAGYTDAEGTFCICRNNGVFQIRVQDKNVVWTIYRELNKISILCKSPKIARAAGTIDQRGTKSNRDIWALTVYRKQSLLKIIKLLGPLLKHRKRRKDMKIVEKNIKDRNIKYNNRLDHRWYKTYNLKP